jgi:hypothetical protein
MDAFPSVQFVPSVATGALPIAGLPLPALIADHCAGPLGTEIKPDCAFRASIPFPFRAAVVGGGVGAERAAAVRRYCISGVAILADADIAVELLAKPVDGAADALLVEDVALRTLHAAALRPGLAPEVVTDQLQKNWIAELGAQRR